MRDSNLLHITIGAAPDPSFDLTHELRLLKAALLYADKVKLCSLSSSALVMLLSLKNLSEDDLLDLLVETASATSQKPADTLASVALYRMLQHKRRRTPNELMTLQHMKKVVDKQKNVLRETAAQIVQMAHGDGIIDALNTGLIEFQFFDISHSAVVEEYYAAVAIPFCQAALTLSSTRQLVTWWMRLSEKVSLYHWGHHQPGQNR